MLASITQRNPSSINNRDFAGMVEFAGKDTSAELSRDPSTKDFTLKINFAKTESQASAGQIKLTIKEADLYKFLYISKSKDLSASKLLSKIEKRLSRVNQIGHSGKTSPLIHADEFVSKGLLQLINKASGFDGHGLSFKLHREIGSELPKSLNSHIKQNNISAEVVSSRQSTATANVLSALSIPASARNLEEKASSPSRLNRLKTSALSLAKSVSASSRSLIVAGKARLAAASGKANQAFDKIGSYWRAAAAMIILSTGGITATADSTISASKDNSNNTPPSGLVEKASVAPAATGITSTTTQSRQTTSEINSELKTVEQTNPSLPAANEKTQQVAESATTVNDSKAGGLEQLRLLDSELVKVQKQINDSLKTAKSKVKGAKTEAKIWKLADKDPAFGEAVNLRDQTRAAIKSACLELAKEKSDTITKLYSTARADLLSEGKKVNESSLWDRASSLHEASNSASTQESFTALVNGRNNLRAANYSSLLEQKAAPTEVATAEVRAAPADKTITGNQPEAAKTVPAAKPAVNTEAVDASAGNQKPEAPAVAKAVSDESKTKAHDDNNKLKHLVEKSHADGKYGYAKWDNAEIKSLINHYSAAAKAEGIKLNDTVKFWNRSAELAAADGHSFSGLVRTRNIRRESLAKASIETKPKQQATTIAKTKSKRVKNSRNAPRALPVPEAGEIVSSTIFVSGGVLPVPTFRAKTVDVMGDGSSFARTRYTPLGLNALSFNGKRKAVPANKPE